MTTELRGTATRCSCLSITDNMCVTYCQRAYFLSSQICISQVPTQWCLAFIPLFSVFKSYLLAACCVTRLIHQCSCVKMQTIVFSGEVLLKWWKRSSLSRWNTCAELSECSSAVTCRELQLQTGVSGINLWQEAEVNGSDASWTVSLALHRRTDPLKEFLTLQAMCAFRFTGWERHLMEETVCYQWHKHSMFHKRNE